MALDIKSLMDTISLLNNNSHSRMVRNLDFELLRGIDDRSNRAHTLLICNMYFISETGQENVGLQIVVIEDLFCDMNLQN